MSQEIGVFLAGRAATDRLRHRSTLPCTLYLGLEFTHAFREALLAGEAAEGELCDVFVRDEAKLLAARGKNDPRELIRAVAPPHAHRLLAIFAFSLS